MSVQPSYTDITLGILANPKKTSKKPLASLSGVKVEDIKKEIINDSSNDSSNSGNNVGNDMINNTGNNSDGNNGFNNNSDGNNCDNYNNNEYHDEVGSMPIEPNPKYNYYPTQSSSPQLISSASDHHYSSNTNPHSRESFNPHSRESFNPSSQNINQPNHHKENRESVSQQKSHPTNYNNQSHPPSYKSQLQNKDVIRQPLKSFIPHKSFYPNPKINTPGPDWKINTHGPDWKSNTYSNDDYSYRDQQPPHSINYYNQGHNFFQNFKPKEALIEKSISSSPSNTNRKSSEITMSSSAINGSKIQPMPRLSEEHMYMLEKAKRYHKDNNMTIREFTVD